MGRRGLRHRRCPGAHRHAGRGGRRRRPDRPDARPRHPRRRREPCSGRPSCGTISAPAPECDRIRTAVGPAAAHRGDRQRRPAGLHGTQAGLGPRPRAGDLGAHQPRAAAQGLPAPPPDRRPGHGQGGQRRDAALRPGRPRLVTRGARRVAHRRGLDAADLRGSGGDRGHQRRGGRRHRACGRARRSWPAAATSRPTRSASVPSRPARSPSRWARRASSSPPPSSPSTNRTAASTPSATPCRAAGT